jgi:hypothetical protein
MPDEGNQNHFPYIIFHFSFFIARMFPKETAKAQRKQSTPRKFSVKKLCPRAKFVTALFPGVLGTTLRLRGCCNEK